MLEIAVAYRRTTFKACLRFPCPVSACLLPVHPIQSSVHYNIFFVTDAMRYRCRQSLSDWRFREKKKFPILVGDGSGKHLAVATTGIRCWQLDEDVLSARTAYGCCVAGRCKLGKAERDGRRQPDQGSRVIPGMPGQSRQHHMSRCAKKFQQSLLDRRAAGRKTRDGLTHGHPRRARMPSRRAMPAMSPPASSSPGRADCVWSSRAVVTATWGRRARLTRY